MDAVSLITRWRMKADKALNAVEDLDDNIKGVIQSKVAARTAAETMKACADELEEAINGAPVRVLRVMEYVGSRKWVEETLSRNGVKGTYALGNGNSIKSAIIGEFPDIFIQPETKKESE